MSSGEKQIVCRRCQETIPADAESCPHCGASVRSYTSPIVAVIFGLIVLVGSALGQLWFFALLGLLIAGMAGYLIYDKRRRLAQAKEETGSISDVQEESSE